MRSGRVPRLPRVSVALALTCVLVAAVRPGATTGAGLNSVIATIDGGPKVVFDWSTSACTPENIPDLSARAFRNATGRVRLVLSHTTSYRMTGPSLNSLTLDCGPISQSDGDADPSQFNDREWIASPYTKNGRTVYALVHNEFQGHTHADQCPSGEYFDCWDNSITLAVSTNGGRTFDDAAAPPGHLVATPPETYDAEGGPSGYRGPSNIIRRGDFYYTFFNVSESVTRREWVCIARTRDLAKPGSWKQQDGTGWTTFVDPYRDDDPDAQLCPALDQDDIGHALNGSVTWSTAFNRYILVGLSADQIDGREVWGVYYALSTDLLDWSRRRLLIEVPLPWTVADPGSDLSYLYPSLLDPGSKSMNFETMNDDAYLYLTRMNHGQASLDRDLIRYPVSLTRTP